jgi:hypothetical protein
MNPDEFEKNLQRQPLRPIPQEWRSGILRAANAAATEPSVAIRPSIGLIKLWRELIWPVRRVWMAFACVWVVIVAVNFADAEKSGKLEARSKIPPGNLITVWEQQEKLLTELNSLQNPDMEKPRHSLPKPRSDRCSSEATV